MLLILRSKYLEMELMVQMLHTCSILNSQNVFKIMVNFSIPTNNKWEFPLFHIFANSFYCQILIVTIL